LPVGWTLDEKSEEGKGEKAGWEEIQKKGRKRKQLSTRTTRDAEYSRTLNNHIMNA